jgi:hypothetical protein
MEKIEGCDDTDNVTDTHVKTWIKESLGDVATTATTEAIANMVLRKFRISMQEKDSGMRIEQLVSDYLTLSREQGWTLIKKQPKLAIKHVVSVLKPAHLKEMCENDLNLEYIELRKDFPSFVKHLRARAAVAELMVAPSRTGKDGKSSDKTSTGGCTKSYSNGSGSSTRPSNPKDSASSISKSKAPKCLNDKTCNKNGKADYHYMVDCPHTGKDAAADLLAKHFAGKADKPKDAFNNIEPAKKVGRVLFKAKNTSLAKMARVEGKLDGKNIIGVFNTGATSSAVARSFVTVAPWILFATLGGITDGTCIHRSSDRSTCTPIVTVSWTPLPSVYCFSMFSFS